MADRFSFGVLGAGTINLVEVLNSSDVVVASTEPADGSIKTITSVSDTTFYVDALDAGTYSVRINGSGTQTELTDIVHITQAVVDHVNSTHVTIDNVTDSDTKTLSSNEIQARLDALEASLTTLINSKISTGGALADLDINSLVGEINTTATTLIDTDKLDDSTASQKLVTSSEKTTIGILDGVTSDNVTAIKSFSAISLSSLAQEIINQDTTNSIASAVAQNRTFASKVATQMPA